MQTSHSVLLKLAEGRRLLEDSGFPEKPGRPSRAGAILSMELVLVLPIILLLLFAVCEFSMLASAQTQISDSARNTARLMSVSGMPADEAEATVLRMLGHGMSQGARVRVVEGQFPGDSCQITVIVPMKNATPDLLWMTGFSVKSRVLTGHALMVVERQAAVVEPDFSDGQPGMESAPNRLQRL